MIVFPFMTSCRLSFFRERDGSMYMKMKICRERDRDGSMYMKIKISREREMEAHI